MEKALFELQIGEDWDQVSVVSLVDNPAIQELFLKFKESDPFKFKTEDDRQIITGPVLIPDLIVTRKIKESYFDVVFRAPQVVKIYEKFMASGSYKNTNFMHSTPLNSVDDCHLFECFLTDPSRGISAPSSFEKLPPFTWFMSYKITDPSLWKLIKENKIRGFSIEGTFSLNPVKETDQTDVILKELEAVAELLKN